MTQVTQELGRMANTVRGGISDIGRSRLAGEQQKTRGALLDYNLGRNRVEDERASKRFALEEPKLKQDSLEAEAATRKGQQVATWGEERGDDVYKNMVFARTIAPKLMKIYNADPDMQAGAFSLRRKDGSLVREIDRDRQAEAEAILSSYKVASTFKDQIQRIEEKEKRLNAQGVPATDPAYGKLQTNKTRAQTVLDSPERMIKVLEGQLAQLSKHGHYPEEIKRIKGEIRIEQAKLMTPRELAKENRAIEEHKETMALRKIQMKVAENALKAAGKTTAKLPPGEEGEKAFLLKKLTHNLSVIEKFKTRSTDPLSKGQPLTEQELQYLNDAEAENKDIMIKLKAMGLDRNSLAGQVEAIGIEMQGGKSQSGSGTPGATVYRNKKTGNFMTVDADGNKKVFDKQGKPLKTDEAAIPETKPKAEKQVIKTPILKPKKPEKDTASIELKKDIKDQIIKYQSQDVLAPGVGAEVISKIVNKVADKLKEIQKLRPPTQKEIADMIKRYMK